MRDQHNARPHLLRTTQIQNKHRQISMSWVGFEPIIPVFKWVKTCHALDGTATVISTALLLMCNLNKKRTLHHYWVYITGLENIKKGIHFSWINWTMHLFMSTLDGNSVLEHSCRLLVGSVYIYYDELIFCLCQSDHSLVSHHKGPGSILGQSMLEVLATLAYKITVQTMLHAHLSPSHHQRAGKISQPVTTLSGNSILLNSYYYIIFKTNSSHTIYKESQMNTQRSFQWPLNAGFWPARSIPVVQSHFTSHILKFTCP
jgi:hypothetical protein